LGRNDFQVKIRGFRIELGEIEARLSTLAGVKEVTVLAREDEPGQKRLVAYYTGTELPAEQLRAHAQGGLPEYMVPLAYVQLAAMPLTANGKLDRRALPAPETGAYATRQYEEPRGEVEQKVAAIWTELLRVERVGRNDHFFELGGHSLLAVQVLTRIQEGFGVELTVSALFQNPTLAALADNIVESQLAQFNPEDLAELMPIMDSTGQ
jgi:acyl carrier protein